MDFRSGGLRPRRRPATLDLTPLIDIIFQLLIFFLLTASFVAIPNIRVELPKASGEAAASEQRDLTIVVTREGGIQFESREWQPDDLRERLRSVHGEKPDARVLIQADRKSYHGKVVQVMDAARAAGFTRMGVAIRRAE